MSNATPGHLGSTAQRNGLELLFTLLAAAAFSPPSRSSVSCAGCHRLLDCGEPRPDVTDQDMVGRPDEFGTVNGCPNSVGRHVQNDVGFGLVASFSAPTAWMCSITFLIALMATPTSVPLGRDMAAHDVVN